MGKKQTLNGFNPDDFEVVDSANEFELVSAPKEAPKIPVSGYNQKTEEIISNIPDLSDVQKDVIRNLAKKGAKADVISNSILTLQGKHPIQSSIGKVEGNDDFRAFADIVTLGNANPKYYVEDDGTPIPLAKGVDAPKEKKVSNIWGSSGDTKDDSKLTTLAKNVWNIMPGVVENAADLIHLPYVLANTAFPQAEEWTDESGNVHNAREADWYKDFKSKIKTAQAETGEKYNAPIVKSENINKFTDLFDSKNYDINPDNVVGTIGSLVKSVGEFAVGGAGIGSVTNATTKGAKVASGFAASYMTQLGDVIDAAKESGLNTEDAYAFATAVTVPLALVDVNMGVEGRILSDAVAKGEKKALIKEIAKGVIKDADGKLTKEALDDAFKATLVANTALVKTWGKETVTDVLGEGGQEALQDFIQKSGEQLYDKLSGDPKFGTDAFSPESFGSYLNNAISGALGGMPTVAAYNKIKRIAKDNEQSKNAMGIISKGESAIKAFKVNVDEEVSKGFMTPEEGEIAKFKIDAYNEYNKQIGDLNIDQEEKRKVFDLSFQKQGLQTEVEGVDKDKLDPIELGKYEAKTKQIKDIQGEINDIIIKSSVKDESVAGEKTIKDLSKPTKKEDENTELSPELKAINDRYKEETGFLPEKEVQRRLKEKEPLKMTEVKPTQFNEKRYNHREKFKQVAEHIDSTPEGRESGVLKVVDFTDPNGKKGKRIEVELPTGHRIWMSSSMAREGSDIMGHFREEHLPKNTSGKRAYEMMEDFPVKMKLVTTREGATGDNTAIKVYNAKTGKIIGWAKATTKGEDILTQPIISADQKFKGERGITRAQYDAEVKRREDLAREEMIDRIEPVDGGDMGGQLTTTPVTPKGPVKPPKQTTPKTKGEFVSSQIEKLKSEGDYDPSLQDFYEEHFGKQFDAANVVPEKTEKPKKGPEQSKAQKLYYKIRSKVRDNFEKYISGKKADSPEETGVTNQEEYNDIVLRDSEVPSELAEAYLSAKNESVDDAEGTVEYAIYEFFSNSANTISEAHFAKYGDPNFANRKDLPAIRTYVSKDGKKIDQVAQEMSGNIGQEVTVQDIINFILDNPTGIKDYENSMKVSQKRALAKKFRAITGETLNDVTAKAIVDEIYGEPVREMDKITDEEARAELEARKKAQEENPDELLQKPKKNEFEAEKKEIEETAKKDGTWMKAPNGEKSNLSQKEWVTVRTKAFKDWFGDWESDPENASKVVDENGEPLVSWHQNVFGENDFTEFKPQSFGTFGENSMFYFAKDKNWVKNFVKKFNPSAKQEARPFFLNIRKPLDLRNKNLTPSEWIKYLSDNNLLTQKTKETLEKAPNSAYYRSEIMPWQIFRYDNGEFRDLLIKNGYDGIIQFDANYGKTNDLTTFVAITPNQIKSTSNEGGFSKEEKNIYLQKDKGSKTNKESIQKVIDVLKKSMPKVKVVIDENLTDKNGNPVAGKWDPKTNTVSVNPNYADTDTPIHEYGHVLIDAIGRDNKVIKAAIKQLEGTDLWKETKQRYPDLNESNLGVEVLAEAIGREGQGIFDTVAEQSRFKTFLDYIFDWLKTKLGLNKNIAKSLAKQIITGRGTKEMEGFSKEDEFQIVGEKAKLSKQIMEGLKSAKNMESMEYSPEEIRLATGWEKAKDGKWRYEIGDEYAQFSDIDGLISSALKITDKDGIVNLGNLNDVFEYSDLYEAYPELKNIKFNIYNGKGFENGYFDPKEGSININTRALRSGNYGSSVGSIKEQSGNLSKLRGVIIHEAQHATQRIENFNGGGSKESAERYLLEKRGLNKGDYSEKEWNDLVNDTYSKFAGEVEANNAVFRSYLTDSEKRDFSLESTEDVDRAVQILFDVNEQYQRPKYKRAEGEEVMSLNDFRETELNRDVEKEKDDINYVNEIVKDKSSTDKERKNAEGLKNTILSRIREDKKKYVDYLDQVRGFEESMDKIVENDGLEDFTLDELLDIYHNSHYLMDNDSALNKAVKLRIATYLTKEQIKELEKNPLWEQKKGAVNKKDLSGIQLFFKSLADIPEYLPGVQVLGKELNRAALEKMKEIRERGEKLTKLAKAVIKEKNGMLGMLNPKGLFSSDSAKYFEYLDNGKGQLITKEEGKKLGITDAQMAYRDYMQELVDLRNATYDENDEIISNDLMKRDKGFMEAWRTEGFLPALAYYLGRGINDDLLVNVRNEQGGYDQKEFSDAQSEILSKTNTFSDKLKAGIKIAKLSYQGKKNKTDAPYVNYKGGLTMKYDKPRPKDKGYSKDFFASGLDLINDYAHVKHMGPLVPLFDSILYLHEKGFDSKLPNVKKFIESEMNDKLYQKQKGFEPTVDATLRFLRRLGSLTTMAFNIPANAVNIFIGNYNNWRQEGLPHILKGNARLFSSGGKLSDKGLDILKQFDVVKFDAESNPQINGAKLFDKLAYFFNKIGEYQIQGSMFLGHMTDEEWNSFEKNESGDWVLKPGVDKKAFTDKMMSYRDAVSSIQGKYDEKDRRMFMRGEIGKSVAQFKTWMPDWFKSRFGKEFINKYGETERGSLNMFTKDAIAELKKDFSGNPFNKNGTFKNKQAARNLRGAITIAALYVATHSGDDDDKKKKKQYYETLSLDNALGNILFVIDPSQMKYLIENPVAVKGTITKFIDALDGVLHGDVKKAKKNAKKLIPYNKLVDQVDMLTGNNKKK